MSRCLGCGSKLQNDSLNKEGYVRDLSYKYCERCFKIKNYNEYIFSDKDNNFYLKKINEISRTNDLVILTLDFLNMFDLDSLELNNPIILLLTKKDIIPRSVKEYKLLDSIKSNHNIKCRLVISSKNNYNLDLLLEKIYQYKTSDNVYVIGLTNSGKSTLVNKMVKNYGIQSDEITVSNLPSTTLDYVKRKINDDLYLIDTPGLIDDGSVINCFDKEVIKKIIPRSEINPKIYQNKNDQSLILEDFLRIDVKSDNIVSFYISNSLDIFRMYKKNDKLSFYKKYEIKVDNNSDLVIKGLGFIRFKNECVISLFLKDNVNYFVRKSII